MTNDGGPAFPGQWKVLKQHGWMDEQSSFGMSLRDWFAGQALVGMLSNSLLNQEWTAQQWATSAYDFADAMLAEREKGND